MIWLCIALAVICLGLAAVCLGLLGLIAYVVLVGYFIQLLGDHCDGYDFEN